MGFTAMTRLAVRADAEERGEPKPDPAPANRSDADTQNNLAQAIEKVTAYVPSDAIAFYVPAVGLVNTTNDFGRWAIYAGGLALTWFLMWVNKKARMPASAQRKWNRLLGIALVAFAAWGAALPNSPFLQFGSSAPRIGGVLVLFLAVVLPALAKRWRLRPQTT